MKINETIKNPALKNQNRFIDDKLKNNNGILINFLGEILKIANEINSRYEINNGNINEKNQFNLFNGIVYENDLDDLIFEQNPLLYNGWSDYYKNHTFYSYSSQYIDHDTSWYINEINSWICVFAKLKIRSFEKLTENKYYWFFDVNWQSHKRFNYLLNHLMDYGYQLLWNDKGEAVLLKSEQTQMLNNILVNSSDEKDLSNFYLNITNYYKINDIEEKKLYFDSIIKSIYNTLLPAKEVHKITFPLDNLTENQKYIFTNNQIKTLRTLINGFRHKFSEDEKDSNKTISLKLDSLYSENKEKYKLIMDELVIEFLRIIAIAKLNKIHLEI